MCQPRYHHVRSSNRAQFGGSNMLQCPAVANTMLSWFILTHIVRKVERYFSLIVKPGRVSLSCV